MGHRCSAPSTMILLRRQRLSQLIIAIWTLLLFSAVPAEDDHTTFILNHFNGSNLSLIGNASVVSNVIRLTDYSQVVIGRALYSTPVQIRKRGSANGTILMSFSTTFVFSIVPPRRSSDASGHGMAFIFTPYKSVMGALPTQYLGLLNYTSDGQSYNHLFAIEFDTVQNSEIQDIDGNHVGVDLNRVESLQPKTAGYWIGEQFHTLNLKSGKNIQAWIDYNHLRDQLNVTIALAGTAKPSRPLISLLNTSLSDILLDQMYVGFSAATGTFVEQHYILAWSFSTNGTAPALDVSHLPSFMSKKSIYRSKGFKAGVAGVFCLLFSVLVVVVFRQWRRAEYREIIEEWELEYWPHRFSYKDLSTATKGFGEQGLLGSGGVGRVYKGIIPKSGLQVAVKCINMGVTEGMKEFIAEISSMGRLQHRNLVQLRGWGRKNQQLFIVYDYMANGSLDRMIFGNPPTVLRWPQRYRILKGVAAGLLYLHEQWEKRVVHRDIKSSNVLLDSELNARLGDFGLARLYDHTQNPQTSHIVGTLGYIAPELIRSGKATPSSDVFSFGIVLLEVACGRRSVEPSKDYGEIVLVDWVRELYAKERLMHAVDPKLGGDFDAEEMQRVLHLGLICSHPEPQGRIPIAQVLQILEGEVPLPVFRASRSFQSRNNAFDAAGGP